MKKEEWASQWQRVNIPVANINLDKSNMRIAWMEDSQISQSTLISLLWDNCNIKEIIKSIELSGFYQHEVPVVIEDHEEKGRYIVVEGNRRLAALKIIQNPALVSLTQKKWLEDLSQKVKADIEIIPVCIAPSRDACMSLLVSKHASEDHSSWKPLMQAYLYWNYLREHSGVSRESIASIFGTTLAAFNSHLKLYNLFRLIKGIEGFDPDVQKTARDAITIPITTFQRILEVKKVAEYLHISDDWSFDDEKSIEFFNNAMRGVVIDVITNVENSRTLNSSADIERFFFAHNPPKQSLSSEEKNEPEIPAATNAPNTSGFAMPSLPGQNPLQAPHSPLNPPPRPKNPAPSRETKSIIRTKIPFGLKNASALKDIYGELCKLEVDRVPNSSVVMFRVFLDKATRKFMERKGYQTCPVVDKLGNRKSEKEKSLDQADFRACLQFLVSPQCNLLEDQVKTPLRLFLKSDDAGKGQIFGMNKLVHNSEVTYTPIEAKALWPQFESYVKVLLTE
jgi:hypothetical protein